MVTLAMIKGFKICNAAKRIIGFFTSPLCLGIIMTTLLALSEAYPLIRRSTGEGFAPCFVLAKTKNNVQEPIQDILVDLIVRTEGAMQIPKAIQAFLRENFLLLQNEIPKGSFLPVSDLIVDKAAGNITKSNIVTNLNAHFCLLYKLVSFVEYSRKHDKICAEKATRTLGDKLRLAKDEIYQLMCDLKIALMGQGAETQSIADAHPVTQEFLAAGATAYNETRRIYVLMDDFESIMEYLNKTYITMKTNLTNTRG